MTKKIRFTAITIFLLALLLRVIGIDWGLPEQTFPWAFYEWSEKNVIHRTFQIAVSEVNPSFVTQPFLHYLTFPLFGSYVLIHYLLGNISELGGMTEFITWRYQDFFIIGRVSIAIFSALASVLTFYIGKKLFNYSVGLIAGLLTCFSLGNIHWAGIYRYDELLTSLFLMTFALLSWLWTNPEHHDSKYMWIATGAGLTACASTRPTGLAILLPIFFVALKPSLSFGNFKNLGLAIATCLLLSCLIFIPLWANPESGEKFVQLLNKGTLGVGYTTAPIKPSIRIPFDLFYALPFLMGIPIFVISMLGISTGWLFQTNRSGYWLVTIMIGSYWLPLGFLISKTDLRHIIQIIPFLNLIIGYFVVGISQRLFASRQFRVGSILCFGVLLVGISAQNVYAHKSLRAHTDTRTTAKNWLRSHLEPNSNLLIPRWGPPVIPTNQNLKSLSKELDSKRIKLMKKLQTRKYMLTSEPRYNLTLSWEFTNWDSTPDRLIEKVRENNVDYIITSSAVYARFYLSPAVKRFDSLQDRATKRKRFYDFIAQHCKKLKVFTPNMADTPGPLIKIYKVPEDFSEKTEVQSGRFEPFETMSPKDAFHGYWKGAAYKRYSIWESKQPSDVF